MSPDRFHPRDHLLEPRATEQSINGGYFSIADVLSVLSPTHWAREAIKNMTGFDIFGEIGEFFVGDWAAFSRAGVAIGNVADALPDVGNNLYFGWPDSFGAGSPPDPQHDPSWGRGRGRGRRQRTGRDGTVPGGRAGCGSGRRPHGRRGDLQHAVMNGDRRSRR